MTARTNSKLAGFAFLYYIAVGVTQMVLSAGEPGASDIAGKLAYLAGHATLERVNVLLTLMMSVSAILLAVSCHALTRDVDRDIALLGFSFRLGEGFLNALATVSSLTVLWLATSAGSAGALGTANAEALAAFLVNSGGRNGSLSATLFAFGSLAFCVLLLRGRRIPAWLAWLGVIASVLLVIGLPLSLVGFWKGSYTQLIWIPMAAFEIPLGVWLIARGVRTTELA